MILQISNGEFTRDMAKFESVEAFESSTWAKQGWKVVRQPSPELKEIVKENEAKLEQPAEEEESPTIELELQIDIERLRETYEEVTGKKISPRFINDVEWLTKKINEASK